jgi:hypothetical protein
MPGEPISPAFHELLGRALTDKDFRAKLYNEQDLALSEYDLNDTDRAAISRLSAEQLEEHASKLGGKSAMTIKVVISKSF